LPRLEALPCRKFDEHRSFGNLEARFAGSAKRKLSLAASSKSTLLKQIGLNLIGSRPVNDKHVRIRISVKDMGLRHAGLSGSEQSPFRI
jgi:hypothetical protein